MVPFFIPRPVLLIYDDRGVFDEMCSGLFLGNVVGIIAMLVKLVDSNDQL